MNSHQRRKHRRAEDRAVAEMQHAIRWMLDPEFDNFRSFDDDDEYGFDDDDDPDERLPCLCHCGCQRDAGMSDFCYACEEMCMPDPLRMREMNEADKDEAAPC